MGVKKVAVIGAGFYGIAALKYLSAEADLEVECFDRRSNVGGMWNYEESPDTYPYLTPIYKNCRCNHVRGMSEFPDYPMPENASSWPDYQDIAEYLKKLSTDFGLDKYIQLETEVTNVHRHDDLEKFSVTTRRLSEETLTKREYDAVVVAVGYYAKPISPDLSNEADFSGDILHSWRYRRPETYKGKTVLLVGSSLSAWDIAWDLSPQVSEVVVSYHSEPLLLTVPDNGRAVLSDVKHFTKTGVVLENGETVTCDAVIYCTGYTPDFPFLDTSCKTKVVQGRVEDLFKMTVHTKVPGLYFTGLYVFTAMSYLGICQALFIASVISGRAQLPSQGDMDVDVEKDLAEHIATGEHPRHLHSLLGRQRKYCSDIEAIGGFQFVTSAMVGITSRVRELILTEKRYITMRDEYSLEAIDDVYYKEIIIKK